MNAPLVRTKTVAIVCGAPSSEMLAPFGNMESDVWVLGNRCDRYPRKTRIFEIHDDLSQHQPDYPQWLVGLGIPLVVGDGFPIKADHVQVFPFADAEDLFGSEYLTSSSAYMVALALLEGFQRIELYGVDMAVDDFEYFWQRPCMEAWIGFAKGRGVNVVIHENSPVLKSSHVEGRNSGGKPDLSTGPFKRSEFDVMAQRHVERMNALRADMEALERQIAAHDGARQAYERMAKVARAVEAGDEIKTLTDSAVIK